MYSFPIDIGKSNQVLETTTKKKGGSAGMGGCFFFLVQFLAD